MKNTILVVDDIETNRMILEEMLQDEYYVMQAESGKQALQLLEKHHEEMVLILLDLLMPEMDGFEVLKVLRAKGFMGKIPVLVISGENSIDAERECFSMGVSDYIRKPFDSILVKRRVSNVVDLFQYKNQLEEKVERQTKELKKQYELLKAQTDRIQKINIRTIDLLGNVVEHRDMESGEHIRRVRGFTKILAKRLMKDYPEYGLTPEKIRNIAFASALHDVGKVAIPDDILLKPGRLTKEEFEYMKKHTTKGCDILDNIRDVWEEDYAQISYEICRYHHERYDGKGYPEGLSGDEIPISAQIVSIADVYDALVSPRVYKKPYSPEEAFHMIINGECGSFSPKLLECLKKVKNKFEDAHRNR